MRTAWTPLFFLLATALFSPAAEIEELPYLFNMSPVSPDNPALARVEELGIVIPVSEFLAYMSMEGPLEETARLLTFDNKRKCLERLIDEHLLLWNARRQHWDQSAEVVNKVKGTRSMMLIETLEKEEIISKSPSLEKQEQLGRELLERCFEKVPVFVSEENYEKLKAELQIVRANGKTGTIEPDLLKAGLARCKLGTVTLSDFLSCYSGMKERPDLETREGVTEVLKLLLRNALFIAEAEEKGLHLSRAFREGLQINRNVLTRFYFQDRLTDKAIARTKEASYLQRLRGWYQSELERRYTYKDKQGVRTTVSFETQREIIENDFFQILKEEARSEAVAELRQGRTITIDEKALHSLELFSHSANADSP